MRMQLQKVLGPGRRSNHAREFRRHLGIAIVGDEETAAHRIAIDLHPECALDAVDGSANLDRHPVAKAAGHLKSVRLQILRNLLVLPARQCEALGEWPRGKKAAI